MQTVTVSVEVGGDEESGPAAGEAIFRAGAIGRLDDQMRPRCGSCGKTLAHAVITVKPERDQAFICCRKCGRVICELRTGQE